jgi:hypothetical protein
MLPPLLAGWLSDGITANRIQTTATTPASVGVNQPVRMPPSRMTGIISGNDASLMARSSCPRLGSDGMARIFPGDSASDR